MLEVLTRSVDEGNDFSRRARKTGPGLEAEGRMASDGGRNGFQGEKQMDLCLLRSLRDISPTV